MNSWAYIGVGLTLIAFAFIMATLYRGWARNEDMPMETEWRLACIIMPALHRKPDGSVIAWKQKVDAIGKTVRVREYRGSLVRAWDCGAKRFFEIHPEDARAQWNSPYKFLVTCEHNLEIAGEQSITSGGIETQYAPF